MACIVPAVVFGVIALGRVAATVAAEPDAGGARVVAIEFECAAPIDRDGLLRIMPFAVGDTLRTGDMDLARWRLEQTEIFTLVTVDAQPRGDGVAVVVRLARKPVINAVRFRGNETLGADELRRAARLHPGNALVETLRTSAESRLLDRYAAQGFDRARITSSVQVLAPGEVDVTFTIEEGEPLRVAAIEIDGALPVPKEDLLEALGVEVGDRYVKADRRTAEAMLVRTLRDAGYFEADVKSRWEPGGARDGVLRFGVEAGPRMRVTFSGNHKLSDKRLLRLIDLPARPIVTDGTWRELARRIHRAYQEAGYYQVRVDLRVEPGPPKVVHFDVVEGESYRVAEVRFEGNRGLTAAVLRAQMATQPPSWIPWRRGVFLDEIFDDDLKRLWFLYRRYGFEEAQIVDARANLDAARGELAAVVYIEEGRQTIVREVTREGVERIAVTLPPAQVVVGAPLDRDQVDAERRALVAALAAAGYGGAEVDAEVTTRPDGVTDAATVRFVARAGAAQHIGAIIVQNDFDTRWRVIERELPFAPGAPLDPDALLRGQSAVYRLGLFRSVTVRPLEDAPAGAPRDVGVSVSEKPPGTFQWGAGYNTRDGIRGFVEVAHNNLQGQARRLSLRGEMSFEPGDSAPNEYIGNLGFREPRLGTSKWLLRANLIAQRSTRSVDQFSLERFAFIPAIERSVWVEQLRAGLEPQVEQSQVFDVKSDVLAFNPRDAGRLRTISVSPFAVYDGRDDPFVPRRGVFESMRVKVAPDELGSDVPFLKATGQHSHYVPLLDDLTFVYAVRGGWAKAYEGGEQVPIRERFFLGGRTTVRGFDENSIGPTGSQGNPLGGDIVLNLNTELRFPLLYGFGGAVFVDSGGVYLQDRAISIHDFRRSTGLGLRYMTPIGPLGLDYGFKLDRRSGESLGQIHFSVGTIF
jgi:outer membrane protein insertion porin family